MKQAENTNIKTKTKYFGAFSPKTRAQKSTKAILHSVQTTVVVFPFSCTVTRTIRTAPRAASILAAAILSPERLLGAVWRGVDAEPTESVLNQRGEIAH